MTIFLRRIFTEQKKMKEVWKIIATEFTYCVFNKFFLNELKPIKTETTRKKFCCKIEKQQFVNIICD